MILIAMSMSIISWDILTSVREPSVPELSWGITISGKFLYPSYVENNVKLLRGTNHRREKYVLITRIEKSNVPNSNLSYRFEV